MRAFHLFGAFVLSIPFYFLWNFFAPIYLPNLPVQYLNVPFLHCAGLFILVEIARLMIFPAAWSGVCSKKFKGRYFYGEGW